MAILADVYLDAPTLHQRPEKMAVDLVAETEPKWVVRYRCESIRLSGLRVPLVLEDFCDLLVLIAF